MSDRIPIISLWMPWANWVALGWKPVETRRHARFKSLVGKRVGIHASLKWDVTAISSALPFLTVSQVEQTQCFLRLGGAIICTARVANFRPLGLADEPKALIECETPRYGLFLEDIQSIEAIPAKGKQGIWYHEVAPVTHKPPQGIDAPNCAHPAHEVGKGE